MLIPEISNCLCGSSACIDCIVNEINTKQHIKATIINGLDHSIDSLSTSQVTTIRKALNSKNKVHISFDIT
jgi:hypothetical protein